MKQEQHAWIQDGENKRAIQCIEWCVRNLKQTKVWWIFSLNTQSPAVTIVSVECDETVSWYFLADAVSRIYELVNAIIHLLDECSDSPYWLGIPMIYLHLCACVWVSDKRLLPYHAASTWTLHFRWAYNCCLYIILSIHSLQLNGILQDDEVNAVFLQRFSSRMPSWNEKHSAILLIVFLVCFCASSLQQKQQQQWKLRLQ